MELATALIVVVVATVAITNHVRRKKQEPHRLIEVTNGLRALAARSRAAGRTDRADDYSSMAQAIHEARILVIHPRRPAPPNVDHLVTEVFRASAENVLEALEVYGDNRSDCYRALLNLGGQLQELPQQKTK